MKVAWFSAVGLLALGLGACTAESSSAPDEGSGSDELNELSLAIVGTKDTTVKDSPALKAGAEGTFACADRFELEGKIRLGCSRGGENLEVIADIANKSAVAIHRPNGRNVDKRTFFACATSGNGPGDLPSKLKCTSRAPTSPGGGGLSSPFASTVDGIAIPNAHAVGGEDLLLRAMAPRNADDYAALVAAKVGAVLVFKNQTGNGHDVADEMKTLEDRGLAKTRIVNIPFAWKDLPDFESPCEQTIEALAFIEKNLAAKQKTLFHCTVGEDRTGFLAAMHRMLVEPELAADRAFDEEMCERGYAAGNPLKPAFVVNALDADTGLTPLYRRMAYLVATKQIAAGKLDASVCKSDPAKAAEFEKSAIPAERLHCGTSTKFALPAP